MVRVSSSMSRWCLGAHLASALNWNPCAGQADASIFIPYITIALTVTPHLPQVSPSLSSRLTLTRTPPSCLSHHKPAEDDEDFDETHKRAEDQIFAYIAGKSGISAFIAGAHATVRNAYPRCCRAGAAGRSLRSLTPPSSSRSGPLDLFPSRRCSTSWAWSCGSRLAPSPSS
mmetsp:Transcript_13740/g.27628  ORF Transcript_13740/g.27628 Transcript_13740/m.27628 type:complete len:172 (-) Transcript_13740:822-1337(-)